MEKNVIGTGDITVYRSIIFPCI